jgi:fatty-acyl-CoA synthase
MINTGWVGDYSYFRARISPNKEAIYDLDNSKAYTYQDLDDRGNIFANYMKEIFEIERGDRIAFISRNSIELFDAYYGTAKIGAILVPYNARLSVEELKQLIINENPKVLFYEEIFSELILELKKYTKVKNYVVLSGSERPTEDIKYESILKYGNKTKIYDKNIEFEDTHMIIHTGGTTGLPKGGMISHRAMFFNAMNEIVTWGISHTDSAHILLPLFHTGGWNLLTLPILHAGGRIMINKQFDPKGSLDIINSEKPTFVFGAATIFRMMVDLPEFETTDFSSVKWIMAGAAPTPKNIMERFWNKGIRFVLGYGMTEAGPNNLTAPAENMSFEQVKEKYGSVGKPMYLTQVKVVDDDGNEVPTGSSGELVWSGPQIFSGYWGNEEETRKTLVDGWIYTGDMAMVDEDGFYYIVGRKKNMYISGGENVFPPEVEKKIYEIEEIHEVCVIGVSDEKWGEVGKAIISLKPGKTISKEEILDKLKGKLAKYKIPRYIEIVDEIPKNSVGKVVRADIMKKYGKDNL